MIEIPAYKDELRNTWYASFYYTDWQGKRRLKKKRGFQRKKDAQAFEEEFLRTRARSCDMTFRSFAEIYLGDMEPRLKRTTMQNKRYLIEHRVLPFFGDLPLNEITPAHVRKWQSQLLADKVAPTYAKTINNQLSAIFNYACKYYGLGINPARLAGSVGKKDAQEMSFWTVEQFNQFIPHVKKLPARTGLSVLFWTGLRIGELLALCPEDIDLEARTLTVRRNFQSVEGEEVITDPKTQRGRRVIPLPEKLCDEIRAYENALYDPQPDDRLFQTVDKLGAGIIPAPFFPLKLNCIQKFLRNLRFCPFSNPFLPRNLASFFRFIHAKVSPAFISIRAFPMYCVYRNPWCSFAVPKILSIVSFRF